MKIAFIGTHGVGKTGLCFELAGLLKKRGLDVAMVNEVARRCPLPVNEGTTVEAQVWILMNQIAREIEVSCRSEIVITDRAVIDNYAYLVNSLRGSRVSYIDPLISKWMGTYDIVVKVPVMGAPEPDGFRDTGRSFQAAVDARVDELVSYFGVPTINLSLLGPGRDAWAEDVLSVIDEKIRPALMNV